MTFKISSKKIPILIAVTAVVLLTLAGTFAWYSITQQRINTFNEAVAPGVNLHDDFQEGPEKEVYVENAGDLRVIVRVKLTEYLQTVSRGSLVHGHTMGEETAGYWIPHTGAGGAEACELEGLYQKGVDWNDEWFHDYYQWTMGGQKWYMPAVKLLGEEEAMSADPGVCVDINVYDGTEEHVKQTLTAFVITMEEWTNGGAIKPDGQPMQPCEQGEFWIVDKDGWCYWAQYLEPGEATGLLLSRVDRTEKGFDSTADYCINVWLQAVDKSDIGMFEMEMNNGITQQGKLLIQLITDHVAYSVDGSFYQAGDNGLFVQAADSSGNLTPNAQPFIPLGIEAAQGGLIEKINTPEASRLYIGDEIELTELIWNGADYANYETEANKGAPTYNISKQGDPNYTIVGSETGQDGNIYLVLEDMSGNRSYMASVLRGGSDPDSEDLFIAGFTTDIYKQGYPGTGPFALIYPGKGGIGAKDDMRFDMDKLEQRFFYHIGNGVYIEVTEEGTAPTTYYFADNVEMDSSIVIDNLGNSSILSKLEELFPLQLTVGESFSVVVDEGDNVTQINSEQAGYVMKELLRDEQGSLYIDIGNGFYIGANENGLFLANENGAYSLVKGEVDGGKLVALVTEGVTLFPMGNGTAESPFNIRKLSDLEWVVQQVESGNGFENQFLLIVNDFNIGAEGITPIGNNANRFNGTFDGGGYTISGLKLKGLPGYAGLFGYVGGSGTVKNVRLVSATIEGEIAVGGIAGKLDAGGIVEDCQVLVSTVNNSNDNPTGIYGTGGIVGVSYGTVKGCENTANVTGGNRIGGIAGMNLGTIDNCVNSGGITATFSVGKLGDDEVIASGGIVGNNLQDVKNSYNIGAVIGTDAAGGVVGFNYDDGDIQSCFSTGNVGGSGYCGGVVGLNEAYVIHCYSWGTVEDGLASGGVAGKNSGTVDKCYHAKGMLGGFLSAGGVVGWQEDEGITKRCVAYSNSVNGILAGSDRVIGNRAGGCVDCFAWSGMSISQEGSGFSGTPATSVEMNNAGWWLEKVGFDFVDAKIWVWSDKSYLPVLPITPTQLQ